GTDERERLARADAAARHEIERGARFDAPLALLALGDVAAHHRARPVAGLDPRDGVGECWCSHWLPYAPLLQEQLERLFENVRSAGRAVKDGQKWLHHSAQVRDVRPRRTFLRGRFCAKKHVCLERAESTLRSMRRVGSRLRDRVSGLSLRWRIGALVLLGLAAIFTLFGVLGSELARDGRQRTIGQWVSLTSSTARFIDAELEAQFDRLTALAARLDGGADDAARWTAFLDDTALQPSTFIVGTFLLDARGALRWTDPALAGGLPALLASDARITDPLRSGGRYASGVRDLGGRPTVVLAVPVPAPGGRAAGVLGTVIRPDAWVVDDLVSSARGLANSGHAELIDQEGQVIVSSEPGRALAGGEHPDFYAPLLAHHGSGVGLTEPVGALDPADQGERHEMAFVSLSNAPWGLALGGADAELSADANRWQTEIATFGALTLFVALLLVWITTRSVARPIRALTAASRSIAAGDLTTPVPRGGEGEVRELAAAFDHMRR